MALLGSATALRYVALLVATVATPTVSSTQEKCLTTGSFFVQKANLHGRSHAFEHSHGHRQLVRAAVAEDGRSASVSLLLDNGQTIQTYHMQATDVISKDADLLAIVDGQQVQTERLSPIGQFFSSSKVGQVAKASIDVDGQVLGLFQHGKHIHRVMPIESTVDDAPPMLVDTDARLHYVRILDFSDDEKKEKKEQKEEEQEEEEKDEEEEDDHSANSKPKVAVDDNHGDQSVLQPLDGDLMPSMESGVEAAWGGTKWFPGCFSGDNKLHVMKLGVAADLAAFKKIKSRANLQKILQQIVHESNIIYENQLNIRLEVGAIRIYETSSGTPSWAGGCSSMSSKLNQFTSGVRSLPAMADWQLMTGCGTGSGVVGLAWVGSLCDQRGQNSGVNQLITYGGTSVPAVVDRTWRIVAHELGHNFNADHSFEQGQGRTGGIMDYGDGKLKGIYQFNTRYRKSEVCRHVSGAKRSGQCRDNFKEAGGGGGGPRPRPTPPGPRPPPGPKPPCRDTDNRCATKWKGKCGNKKVQKKCPQSCNRCDGGGGSPGECEDKSSKCQKMKSRCSKGNVRKKCALTCGVCSKSGS